MKNIKTILYCFLLFIFISPTYGQQKIYIEGKELKKYGGEWVGVHGVDTFRIILKYREGYKLAPNYMMDAIFGWHCYSENGVKESNNITSPLNYEDYSIHMTKSVNGDISISFRDRQRKKGYARIFFTIVPGTNNTKAIWKIEKLLAQSAKATATKTKEGVRLNYEDVASKQPESKITAIPEWTMTKVN